MRSTSQHVADLLSKRDSLHETSAMSRSECEREARDAAADLVLSASLPRLVRMGSRVLDSDKMRKLLDYNSIGCKQALRIFDELVDAESEPVEPDFPRQCLEKRLDEWMGRWQNAPATPPVKPQSPRQPIHLNLKRKADHQPDQQAEQEATTVLLLLRAARCAPEPAASAEDFMNNAGELIFESAAHVALVCEEFRHTGPGVREADLLDCLYEVGEEKCQCKGCAWAAWRLMGQAQQIPSVTHATLQPEEGASFFHKTAMKLLPRPPPFTRLYKLGKGKLHDLVKLLACCRAQRGTVRSMTRSEYDAIVGTKAVKFSPRRVLKKYEEMTLAEFQSHIIKLDTIYRGDKALNTGKRPPTTEEEFTHLQSRGLMQLRKQLQEDQVQVESLLVSCDRQLRMPTLSSARAPCWWYNAEVHQKQTMDFFEAYGSSRRAEDPDLLRRQRQRQNSSGKLPGRRGSPQDGPGRVRYGVQPGHAAIRGGAQPSARRAPLLLDELQISGSSIGAQGGRVDTLKHLLGLSPDLAATIKCRYHDVKVQTACPGQHGKGATSGPHTDAGMTWTPCPLDKLFDADTRGVLKRCILVEVTAQCVKEVRDKRKTDPSGFPGGELLTMCSGQQFPDCKRQVQAW